MNTCDTCRWWRHAEEGQLAGSFSSFRVCKNPKLNLVVHVDESVLDGAGASASDADGLGFWTGPKFGCVRHDIL